MGTLLSKSKEKKKPSNLIEHRVHTRKVDRDVARARMKEAGLRQINKHEYFANHWRDYCKD